MERTGRFESKDRRTTGQEVKAWREEQERNDKRTGHENRTGEQKGRTAA